MVYCDKKSTNTNPGTGLFIHSMFEKSVLENAEAIALSMGDVRLTYSQLNSLSNKISHTLIARGVSAGDIVGVSMKRSPELIATVIAILKAGASYLPLDPEYPVERLKYMVNHSRVEKIIAHQSLAHIFKETTANILISENMYLPKTDHNPEVDSSKIDLAYVIYTSGSTGNPKGVSMGHRALVNLIEWQNDQTIFKTNSITLQFTPLSFDVHFQEIFSTLTLGGELVMIPEETRLDTYSLLQVLESKKVNRLFLPYVALNHLSEIAVAQNLIPQSLKEVTTAGEQLKITINIRSFFKKLIGATLYNHYGPSESHVVTSLTLSGDPENWPALPTIGKAIFNSQTFILDENLIPVEDGVEGDIYLGGVCLANGYLHSPDLTNERFLTTKLGRIYKTGDTGFVDTNGNIVFLGRKDGQVKIRGYRIELGEIELAIMKQNDVSRGVVKIIETEDDKYICAYITGNVTIGKLREALRAELPEYMVPAHFLKIDSIPLTPSGKVDYKSLPVPDNSRPELAEEFVAAETTTQKNILKCWKKYIKIKDIGIDDNFFDLGGTSLLAIKILIDINQVSEKKLTVVNLFQYPTIRKISSFIDNEKDELDMFLERNESAENISGDIAVIGMTGRFPGAGNVNEFWENLVAVKDSLEKFERAELNPAVHSELSEDENYVFIQGQYPGQKTFDHKFFGMTPREAELMDPQQRKFLELTHEGLELAGYNPENYQGSIGVFAGMGNSKYSRLVDQYPEKVKTLSEFNVMLGLEKDYIATRVAFKLNLKGPALSIHTACSTSLVAIIEAVKNLRLKNCDMALAGGISISGAPNTGHLFQEGGILTKNGECRSFDSEATGTVFTDGGGVVVLKRLSDAEKDGDTIFAVIKGVGINNDGANKMSFTAPSVLGQAEAILRAQRDANISADTIGLIEAHGTATPVGDPIEVEALTKAFRKSTDQKNYCVLTSLKSNMGHLTGAAGVASFIKAVKAVNTGVIPGTAHYQSPNKLLSLDESPFVITNETKAFPEINDLRRAGISSFGVGGTNAHVIIEEYKSPAAVSMDQTSSVFKLSAKTQKQLELMQMDLVTLLKATPSTEWKKIAYTLEVGRKEYKFRSFIVARVEQDLMKFSALNSGSAEFKKTPELMFMFPGQGSHYKQMGKGLYETSGVFRDIFDQCCKLINKHLTYNIKDIILDESSEENLNNTFYSQPAIFIIEYSLAMTLKTLGYEPKNSIGHSIGEFVAATLNGVFSLEDGLRAIAKRAELMQKLPVGMMLSVSLAEDKLRALVSGRELDIAVINGSQSCVVAGSHQDILEFKQVLADLDIASIELKTSHAFHSRMMKPAVAEFKDFLMTLKISAPKSPMYSTVTTNLETELIGSADYWANHIVDPVQFSKTISRVLAVPGVLLLEVGTRNILTNLSKKEQILVPGSDTKIVTLLGSKAELENASFNKALGDLWLSGIKASDASIMFDETDRKRVPATPYIFEESVHWLEPKNKSTKGESMSAKLSSLQNTLIEIFERSSGIEVGNFDKDTTFLEMGMDSLFLTQVALLLKKELKTTLTFRQLMEDFGSINLLANHLIGSVEVKVEEAAAPAPAPVSAPVMAAPAPVAAAPAQTPAPVINIPSPASAASIAPVQTQTRVNIQPITVATSGTSLENIINRQLELMSQQIMLLSGNQISSGLTTTTTTVEVAAPVAAQIAAPVAAPAKAPEAPAAPAAASAAKGKVAVTNVKEAFGAQARISTEKTTESTPAQQKAIKDFFEKYTTKTKGSKTFTQDNRKNHADPRVVTGFKPESKEVVYPIVVKKSYLQTLWDLDDNKYIDMTCGFGSNFFGNGNERIKKHVLKQIEEGIELGPQHPLVAEVSNMINEMTGNERTAFCNTGSEAVLGAMRIARTVTGREKIIVFSGSYHGINDEVILRGSKSGKSFPAAPGINGESVSNMIVLDYGTAESLQIIREMSSEVAAVLVEPVQSRRCNFHPAEFLREVRKITLETNTCLIFDEIITGFRVHPAGAQGYFGIRADLCTYGKIVGGGMPIGVVSGKTEYMDALDGGFWQYGDDSTPTVGVTYFAGTFVRHPLALAAAKGALEILKEGGVARLDQLNKRAQKFADDLNLFLMTERAPIHMDNFGPLMKPKWDADIASGDLLFAILRYNGVHVYDGFPWFINLAHTEEELNQVLAAFKTSVKMMQEMGLFPSENVTGNTDINLDPKIFDQKGAPMVGAKIGKDEKGNPAWFVENPETPGEYYKLKG